MIKTKEDVKKIIEEIKKGFTLEFIFDNNIWGDCFYRVSYSQGEDLFITYWYNLRGNESLKPSKRDIEEIEKFIWGFRKEINKTGDFLIENYQSI